MFETKKTLIVVYRDELLINQLRKLVETKNDDERGVVGTRDDSINIVSWTEKVWLENKKAGNIQGKILFIGEIKDTDKLIPIVDVKFDECGVRFGWAGNQAVVYADPKMLTTRESYDAFLGKLSALPVPEILKTTKERISSATGTAGESDPAGTEYGVTEEVAEEAENKGNVACEQKHKHNKRFGVFKVAKKGLSSSVEVIGKAGTQVASKFEEVFRNKGLMKRQMLYYGVVCMYNDWLEKFMNA